MPDHIYGGIYTSSANTQVGVYPYINVRQSESGHLDITDDTPGNEFRRWEHGKSRTREQWSVNGDREVVVTGNNFTVTVGDNSVVVQGVCNIEVHGDSKLHVYGSAYAHIEGDMQTRVQGDAHIHTDGDLDVTADGDVNISAGGVTGDIYLNAPSDVIVSGDLRVNGEISCMALSAKTNITAVEKVFATGGIETLGGINVGFATPGPYIPTGVLTCVTSINSPLALLGISGAVLTYDVINDGIYDFHVHPVPPHNLSGFPIQTFLV